MNEGKEAFQRRCREFPSFAKNVNFLWFPHWSKTQLVEHAQYHFKGQNSTKQALFLKRESNNINFAFSLTLKELKNYYGINSRYWNWTYQYLYFISIKYFSYIATVVMINVDTCKNTFGWTLQDRWRYISMQYLVAVVHIVWFDCDFFPCRHRLDDSHTEGEHLPHVGLHAPGSPSAGWAGEGCGRVLSHHQHQLREVRREVSVSSVHGCTSIKEIRF